MRCGDICQWYAKKGTLGDMVYVCKGENRHVCDFLYLKIEIYVVTKIGEDEDIRGRSEPC